MMKKVQYGALVAVMICLSGTMQAVTNDLVAPPNGVWSLCQGAGNWSITSSNIPVQGTIVMAQIKRTPSITSVILYQKPVSDHHNVYLKHLGTLLEQAQCETKLKNLIITAASQDDWGSQAYYVSAGCRYLPAAVSNDVFSIDDAERVSIAGSLVPVSISRSRLACCTIM